MAFDYVSVRDQVSVKLIQEFGMPATVTRIIDEAEYVKGYDSVEGRTTWTKVSDNSVTYTQPTATTGTYTGIVGRLKYDTEQIDGTNIRKGDMKLLTITLPEPQNGDLYEVDGVTYKYVDHENVSPGGVDVLYKIQVRV